MIKVLRAENSALRRQYATNLMEMNELKKRLNPDMKELLPEENQNSPNQFSCFKLRRFFRRS